MDALIDSEWAEKISEILNKHRRKHGAAKLERVQECFLMAMGRIDGRVPHAKHRSKIYFPGLTDEPWPEPRNIKAISILEDNYEVIKEELLYILDLKRGFQPYGILELTQIAGDWNVFYFKSQKLDFEENRDKCPRTTQIIDSLPQLGQVAMFSALNPRCRIEPHYGTWNVRLTVHLGLIIPQPCAIQVGGQTRTWEEGKCIVFDDSYLHGSWNDSDRTRFILFVDVWHPNLAPAEIDVLDEISHVISTEELKAAQIIEGNKDALLNERWWSI